MRFSGSLLSSFILFVFSFSPFWRVLSQIVATFLGLWKCGVTIAECAHVHSFVQSAWNVYNLPRTAAAEISTELDESWMCVCLSLSVLARAWEVFGGKSGEKSVCGVLTVVETILLQSCGWSRTRCLPENPFQASMVSF